MMSGQSPLSIGCGANRCIDGFYSKSSELYGEEENCMNNKDWVCGFEYGDDTTEIIKKHPECQEWITYALNFQRDLGKSITNGEIVKKAKSPTQLNAFIKLFAGLFFR